MTYTRIAHSADDHDGEDAYRIAFRSVDAAAAILDVSDRGRLIDATERFLASWRLDRSTVLQRPLAKSLPPSTAARLLAVAREASLSGEPALTTLRNVGPAHARFSALVVRAVPLTGSLVSLTLLTNPSIAESRRNALIDDVGAVSGGMIYIYDVAKQRTRHANANLAQMLGFAPGSSVHLSAVLPLVHPDDVAQLIRHVEGFSTLADGQVSKFSFRLKRQTDDSWRWVENRVGVFARGAHGEVCRVIGYAFDVTVPHQTADELADAATALLNAEEKERRRIARELHDSTAQHVVAADLMIAAHVRKHEDQQSEALATVREILSQALREIRTFSFLLHPPCLRREGLGKTLQIFAEGFANRSGLALDISLAPLPEKLKPAIEMTLFRVTQEAFMNVRRHANASRITLRLDVEDDEFVLEIEDNGIGLGDVETLNQGVGIDGMRARLTSIGGAISIEDTGKGTRVRARAPKQGIYPESDPVVLTPAANANHAL